MHGSYLTALPSVLMLLLFGFLLVRHAGAPNRQKAMQALAERLGLGSRPENSLPRDLDLSATRFKRWTRVFNVYDGVLNGLPVMLFDLNVNQGKAGWARTLVAVRTPAELSLDGTPGLEVKRCGPWLLYYKPLGFWLGSGMYTKPEELHALLTTLTGNRGHAGASAIGSTE